MTCPWCKHPEEVHCIELPETLSGEVKNKCRVIVERDVVKVKGMQFYRVRRYCDCPLTQADIALNPDGAQAEALQV